MCTAVWGLKRLPCGGHFTHWRSQAQRNKGRSQELLGRFLEGVTRKQTSKMVLCIYKFWDGDLDCGTGMLARSVARWGQLTASPQPQASTVSTGYSNMSAACLFKAPYCSAPPRRCAWSRRISLRFEGSRAGFPCPQTIWYKLFVL